MFFLTSKNVHISATRCPIEMEFRLKCSILNGQVKWLMLKTQNWILLTCDSFPLIMSQMSFISINVRIPTSNLMYSQNQSVIHVNFTDILHLPHPGIVINKEHVVSSSSSFIIKNYQVRKSGWGRILCSNSLKENITDSIIGQQGLPTAKNKKVDSLHVPTMKYVE